jgi:hypothetical protein
VAGDELPPALPRYLSVRCGGRELWPRSPVAEAAQFYFSARRYVRSSAPAVRRGNRGEVVVSMAARDGALTKAFGDVTADLLTRLGAKVDYVAVDWGTVVNRRSQKAP